LKTFSLEKQLSRRVILLNAVIFTVVVLAFNIIISFWLIHEHDEEIEAKAQVLIALIKNMPGDFDFNSSHELMSALEASVNQEYFQIWIDNQSVFENFHSFKSINLPFTSTNAPVELIHDMVLPDGRRGRMIQITFLPQVENEPSALHGKSANSRLVTLLLANEREDLDFLINSVHIITVILTVFILIVLYILVKNTVRNSFKPIHIINQQIQALDAEKLHNKLQIESPPDELKEFIQQFNLLLNRLDRSFYREQRFSSDVAHELRTPIAELRTMSEIALKWPSDMALAEEFFSGVYDASIQMQALVNNLLALARCEKGNINLSNMCFSISDMIEGCWGHFSQMADKKEIRLNCDIPDKLLIESSHSEFEQIITNLLSNAISYSRSYTELLIQVEFDGVFLSLLITNTTDLLNVDDLDFMFDRLWRKNKARSPSEHSGLGLSLVKAYVDLLDLEVATKLIDGEKFMVTISKIKHVNDFN